MVTLLFTNRNEFQSNQHQRTLTVISKRLEVLEGWWTGLCLESSLGLEMFGLRLRNIEKTLLKKFSQNPSCQPQMISFHIENKNKDEDKIKFIPRLLHFMNHPNRVTRIFPSTIPQNRLKWHWNKPYFPIFNGTKFIWVKQWPHIGGKPSNI